MVNDKRISDDREVMGITVFVHSYLVNRLVGPVPFTGRDSLSFAATPLGRASPENFKSRAGST